MGSCCSCPHSHNIPDNHHSKFKVINVDDDGNELGSGMMELTEEALILHTRRRDAVTWPYLSLRRYGYDSNLFSFESGRRCQTGQGIFAFKCVRAEEIFNMLQEIMHNNSISVVEELVMEPEIPAPPLSPSTLGYSVPTVPNGFGHFPSVGEVSSRHPSVGSSRLPSVGEESTHPLLLNDETIHTYVNTPGLQEERCLLFSGQTSLDPQLSNQEIALPAPANELEPCVVLESESVKFVLGPTPIQRLRESQGQHVAIPKAVNGTDLGCDSEGLQNVFSTGARRIRPPLPLPDAHNANNSAQRRTALLNYENLPILPPVWEKRKPQGSPEGDPKSSPVNGFHAHEPQHNYINTENKSAPPKTPTSVFSFESLCPLRQLNYIEVEMDIVSDSSGTHTPKTPNTPLPATPTRRTELYAVIDIEKTNAMSNLQKAQPRDDGSTRKTRHNSTDLPM
ncbi:hypothetical protein DNTS_006257 [Danionella cerebrum]|uniref:IRS-type PTB domain-containing protein n=1 Tax=Danionella cerebrum TaxID=2873325 RepID=A0A553QFI8_9TELE|nr:hypothetical protein DNTS_006257 [Danionella translucida]